MKKLIFYIAMLLPGISIGQFKLTAEEFSQRAGDMVTKQRIQYIEPGAVGTNAVWDFSAGSCQATNSAEIFDAALTEKSALFANANASIAEGDKYFYYRNTNTESEYIGMAGIESIIMFNEPIVQMRYPFAFGEKISGIFTGSGMYNSVISSNIKGDYTIEADGQGTLLLPGGVKLQNVLRIKSVRNTIEVTACSHTETKALKYSWFIAGERYPVAVTLINSTYTSGLGITESKSSYYNDKIKQTTNLPELNLFEKIQLSAYPNPYNEETTISYNLSKPTTVDISVYNNNGQKVHTLLSGELQQGKQQINFNGRALGLNSGIYYIHFLSNSHSELLKLVQEN
ncbi:MAG TPA: hypothetical protein DCQ31_00905 [Bacteroidales bacterium]|nr:hypothetical protein [Bacteroidales bacterium]